MAYILGILALLFILYYIVIVLYSGITTSFSVVWLVLALFCVTLSVGRMYYFRNKERIPLWVPVSVISVCCAGILVFAVTELLIFMAPTGMTEPNLDYLIVLGAGVKDEELSYTLKKRLERAAEYIKENPGTVLVLSGGKGADEPVHEAIAMRDYLVFKGVSEKQLILEMQSTSTVENIAYSKVAIDKAEERKRESYRQANIYMEPGTYDIVPEKPVKIGVLTSDFHLFRAVSIAKKRGITDITGVSSVSDPILVLHFCVRECVAILKDKFMGNM